MEKINLVELLKDCPKGMELDCIMLEGSVVFEDISEDDEYPIGITLKNGDYTNLTKYGQYLNLEEAKCVIFPKGKTTWEGFVPPHKFKDGDVLFVETIVNRWIFIYKENENEENICKYVAIPDQQHIYMVYEDIPLCSKETVSKLRFATEKEKEKLFQSIKDNGYKWNAETKTLENLPEFKDGDVIFVVNRKSDKDFQYESIAIFKEIKRNKDLYVHGLYSYNDDMFSTHPYLCEITNSTVIEFATEGQKEKLFNLIKINGYKWNAETKTLEELVEPIFKMGDRIKLKSRDEFGIVTQVTGYFYTIKCKNHTHYLAIKKQDEWELVPDKFDITTLKPFDKVLVRNDDKHVWEIQFFERLNTILKDSFVCMGRERYHQCIPYEGNEHLLNKVKDCDEYFKTWK